MCVSKCGNAVGGHGVIGAGGLVGNERIVVNACHSCELSGNKVA